MAEPSHVVDESTTSKNVANSTLIVATAQPIDQRKIIKRTVPLSTTIPSELLNDQHLNSIIAASLPPNYNFEIHKIIWRIRSTGVSRVGLQFPEGLFVFSIQIARILEEFTSAQVVVHGDVTYGACCIDDFTASALGCDLLVHFAHSCLVPVTQMLPNMKVLYVFVDIKFDTWHFIETIKANLDTSKPLAIAGTIQFVSSIHAVSKQLEKLGYKVTIPQSMPLSKGEVLGCTAPKLQESINDVLFVADGRFHLEAIMIANPQVDNFYRYNPYNKEITKETYHFTQMIATRQRAIERTRHALEAGNATVGLLLSSLGRQGSKSVFSRLTKKLQQAYPDCNIVQFVVPEIQPAFLNELGSTVQVWVQVACPRLSIDWGDGFVDQPLLTPYELNLALRQVPGLDAKSNEIKVNLPGKSSYPMDFYAYSSLGDWTPSHKCNMDCQCIR